MDIIGHDLDVAKGPGGGERSSKHFCFIHVSHICRHNTLYPNPENKIIELQEMPRVSVFHPYSFRSSILRCFTLTEELIVSLDDGDKVAPVAVITNLDRLFLIAS